MADIAEVLILIRDQGLDTALSHLDQIGQAEDRATTGAVALKASAEAMGFAFRDVAVPAASLSSALAEATAGGRTFTESMIDLTTVTPETAAALGSAVEAAASLAAGLTGTHPAIAATVAEVAALRAEAGLLPASMAEIASANAVAAASFDQLAIAVQAAAGAQLYSASAAGHLDAERAAALSVGAASTGVVLPVVAPSASQQAQLEKATASMEAYFQTLEEVKAAGGDVSNAAGLYSQVAGQAEALGAVDESLASLSTVAGRANAALAAAAVPMGLLEAGTESLAVDTESLSSFLYATQLAAAGAAAEGLRPLAAALGGAGGGAEAAAAAAAGGADGFDRLGNAAATAGGSAVLATAKLLGVTLTVAGMVKAAHDAAGAAIEQENALAGLNAQLSIQGRYTETLSASLVTQARSLETTTTYSDQFIERVQTMLATFPRLSNQQLPQATAVTLELATAMGVDAVQAARNLGVALDDPVGGMERLSRAGIRIPPDMRETVKALVDVGDVAGADTLILDYLSDRLGGRAAAAAQTFGGQLSQAKNAVVDLLEQIGNIVIKSDTARDGIADLRDYVNSLTVELGDWITANRGLIDQDIGSVIGGIAEAGRGLPTFLATVRDDSVQAAQAVSGVADIIDVLWQSFRSLPPEAQKILTTGVIVNELAGPVAGVSAAAFVGASDAANAVGQVGEPLSATLGTLAQTPEVMREVNAAAADLASAQKNAGDQATVHANDLAALDAKLEGQPSALERVSDAVSGLSDRWAGLVQRVRDYLGLDFSESGAAAGLGAVEEPSFVPSHAGATLATSVSAAPAVSTDAKQLAEQYAELAGNTRLVFDATGAVQGAMSAADIVYTATAGSVRDVVAEYNAYAAAAGKVSTVTTPKPDKETDAFVRQVLADIHDGQSEFDAFQQKAVKALGEGKLSADQFSSAMGFAVEKFTGAREAAEYLQADYARLTAEATRVWTESRTPAEKYAEALQGVNELLDHHLITTDTAAREMRTLTDAFDANAKAMRDSVDPADKLADAIAKINAAAVAHPDIITPDIQTKLIDKATTDANSDTNKGFTDILNATEGFGKKFSTTLADGLATGRIEWRTFLESLVKDIDEILLKATVGDFITGFVQSAVVKPLEKSLGGGQGFLGIGSTLGEKLIGTYVSPTATPTQPTGPAPESTVEGATGFSTWSWGNDSQGQFFTKLEDGFNTLITSVEQGFSTTFSSLESLLSGIFGGGGGGFSGSGFGEALLGGLGIHLAPSPSSPTPGGGDTGDSGTPDIGSTGGGGGGGTDLGIGDVATAADFRTSSYTGPRLATQRQSAARLQNNFTINFTHNIATLDPRTHAQLLQQQQPVLEKIVTDSIRRGGKLAAAVGARNGGNG